jgi:hypothetical protein
MREIPGAFCCHLDCPKPATWEVVTGRAPDDYTHACDDHAGHLAHHPDATGPIPGGVVTLEPITGGTPNPAIHAEASHG